MFSLTKAKLHQAWITLINPKNLNASFIVWTVFLRTGGLFPYILVNGHFRVSYPAMAITLAHLSTYTYVSISLLVADPLGYSKPLIVDSTVCIGAKILIKSLGMGISLATFSSILLGMNSFIRIVTGYEAIMQNLTALGINANHVFKQILVVSSTTTMVVFSLCLYTLIHSLLFYEKLTNQHASMQFFFMIGMSNYYKNMCLYSLGTYLCTNYLLVTLLNRFLEGVLEMEMQKRAA